MPLLDVALSIENAAPFLVEAFLDALIVECTTLIRLSNTSIGLHRLNPRSNTLVMVEVKVLGAAASSTRMAYLVHCTDVFLVDALLRETAVGIPGGTLSTQWALLPFLVRIARPLMTDLA